MKGWLIQMWRNMLYRRPANDTSRQIRTGKPQEPRQGSATMGVLGILFEIEHLGKTDVERTFYGDQARQIFMQHLDPKLVGPMWLWHGDTQATLNGTEDRFCIAIMSTDAYVLDRLRSKFALANSEGLAPIAERFFEDKIPITAPGFPEPLRREPLDLWLAIDGQGRFCLFKPMLLEDVSLCRKFGRRFRTPDVEEAAEAVLKVCRGRGIAISDSVRDRILAIKDQDRLERWIEQYAFVAHSMQADVAASISELLGESAKATVDGADIQRQNPPAPRVEPSENACAVNPQAPSPAAIEEPLRDSADDVEEKKPQPPALPDEAWFHATVERLVSIYLAHSDHDRHGAEVTRELRQIGVTTNTMGGLKLMRAVHAKFSRRCKVRHVLDRTGYISAPRSLESRWNGIGHWQS